MTTCPELHEIHAFVDGQLTSERWQYVDAHQRDCGACRDALRSIARLNRALMRPHSANLSPDFEIDFRERLLSRMVSTDDVGRLRKLQRRDLVLAASLAALLVVGISLFLGQVLNKKSTGLELAQQEDNQAPTSRLVRSLREAVSHYLDGLGPEGPGPADQELEGLSLRFSAAGRNMAKLIEDEAETSAPDREAAALMTLARLGDSQASAALQRHIDKKALTGQALKAALQSLVLMKSEMAPRRIREAADRLSIRDSLHLLAACEGRPARESIVSLARREAEEHPEDVARGLQEIDGLDITRLLLELSFTHQQSDAFVVALAARGDALAELRRVAFKETESHQRREQALSFLGRLRDQESRGQLVSLCADDSFRAAAISALAEMGGDRAVADIIRGLDVEPGLGIAEVLNRNGAALQGLMRLGNAARVEILASLNEPQLANRAAYILALGRVAQEGDLEFLSLQALNSEFEQVALAGMVMMDSAAAREYLMKLLRHRDADLRRLAREALEVLELSPPKKRRWAGYA